MRWGTYFAVCSAVISIGLALGVTMPLVSLRLASWGHGSFAIGVMAATPAIGVLLGASLVGDGWQQMPAEIERSDGGYSIPVPAAPVSPYVLFVRYREGEATRILASAVGEAP